MAPPGTWNMQGTVATVATRMHACAVLLLLVCGLHRSAGSHVALPWA